MSFMIGDIVRPNYPFPTFQGIVLEVRGRVDNPIIVVLCNNSFLVPIQHFYASSLTHVS